jgi:hypothetical protein
MEHTAAKAVTWERIPAGRLLRVGVLAAGFSAIANALVRPIRAFWGIAVVGLLLSFLPIALAGVTGQSAGALALMHVVAAATNVGFLTALAGKR